MHGQEQVEHAVDVLQVEVQRVVRGTVEQGAPVDPLVHFDGVSVVLVITTVVLLIATAAVLCLLLFLFVVV